MKQRDKSHCKKHLYIIAIILIFNLIKRVSTISCFVCDALEKQISDCPGWDRLPVHSITNLGDKNGFYTHCLDVRLEDNTVLHQNIIPYSPTCRSDFIMIWKESLEKQYKTNITITCCDYNGCNGPIMRRSVASNAKKSHVSMALLIFSFLGTWKTITISLIHP